jgi:hypothetical protein
LAIECHPELLEIPEKMIDGAQARRRARVTAKPRPEPEKKPAASAPSTTRVLPMQLQIGDRLTDEPESGKSFANHIQRQGGKNARVRVQRVDEPAVTDLRTWGAHERISVKRARATERGTQWYLGSASTLALKG